MSVFQIANGSKVTTLPPGDMVQVTPTALAAPGDSAWFCVRQGPSGINAPRTLNIYPVLTGSPATVTATLNESGDGGTTFLAAPNGSALDLTKAQQVTVIPGKIYKITLGTLSGGTASFNVGCS